MKKNFLIATTLASLTCFEARTEDVQTEGPEEEVAATTKQDVISAQVLPTATLPKKSLNEVVPVASSKSVPDGTENSEMVFNKINENIEIVDFDNGGEEEDEPSVIGSDSTERPSQKDFFVVNDPPSDEENDE